MSSKYSEVWNKLKTTGYIKLAALSHQHYSLKKAIKKRKYKDLKFKYEISLNDKISYLEFVSQGNILEVKLIIKPNPLNL